ncbi:MAG: isoprenylcysteine carboxylmethyltransferase family protein [Pseudomonadota bacterium]
MATLRDEFETSGTWLFRYRSFLPILLLFLFLGAFRNFEYPFQSEKLNQIWELICLAISFIGLGIRIFTLGSVPKGTSGRNTKRIKAYYLNTTGMYSIVRHPLYLGNFIIGLGISFYFSLWWFTLIFILIFWLYYERIIFTEEDFLRKNYGQTYLQWANQAPTFIPKFKNWKSPALPFTFKTALKGEYGTFMAIIATFTFLAILGDYFAEGKIEFDLMWVIIFSFGLITYIIVRIIHKKTTLLKVGGR